MQSRAETWRSSFAAYTHPRVVAVLLMGFSSGLPLRLTGFTLSIWLSQSGVSRTAVGLFVLVGSSYTYKFLWSPIIDRMGLGFWTRWLGRRRGWALLLQLLLIPAIVALGFTDPRNDLWSTALFAVIVAFLSASQDIVIDAYRIELLSAEQQGHGVAVTQWGYRFGMIAAGGLVPIIADAAGWGVGYVFAATLMAVGMLTVWFTPEPATQAAAAQGNAANRSVGAWLKDAYVGPFAEFMTRPGWLAILIFVILYKLGDALLGVMAAPFYVAMGFTGSEIGWLSGIFGIFVTLAGVATGALVVERLGFHRALLVCGVAQMLSNLMYVAQFYAGHDMGMLTATIVIENFTGGMGSTAFVAYLSSLCNIAFTATQYALLSSLATVPVHFMTAAGGFLADQFDWVMYFLVTVIASLPGLVMVLWMIRRFPAPPPSAQGDAALAD